MITVLIAVDTRIYRDGLVLALRDHPVVTVAGTAGSFAEALDGIRTLTPNVVLLDIGMPGAVEVALFTRGQPVDPKIVALSVVDLEAEIVAWAELGVASFVTRDDSVADLVRCTIAATEGELCCSPRAAGSLLRRVAARARGNGNPALAGSLSRRQLGVLDLIGQGLSNKEISASLGIEVATVKNHVHTLLGKLKVKRRGEAAALSRRAALATPTRPDRFASR